MWEVSLGGVSFFSGMEAGRHLSVGSGWRSWERGDLGKCSGMPAALRGMEVCGWKFKM